MHELQPLTVHIRQLSTCIAHTFRLHHRRNLRRQTLIVYYNNLVHVWQCSSTVTWWMYNNRICTPCIYNQLIVPVVLYGHSHWHIFLWDIAQLNTVGGLVDRPFLLSVFVRNNISCWSCWTIVLLDLLHYALEIQYMYILFANDSCRSLSYIVDVNYDTIRYDTTILTCAQKQTSSQLSLPHDTVNYK